VRERFSESASYHAKSRFDLVSDADLEVEDILRVAPRLPARQEQFLNRVLLAMLVPFELMATYQLAHQRRSKKLLYHCPRQRSGMCHTAGSGPGEGIRRGSGGLDHPAIEKTHSPAHWPPSSANARIMIPAV